MLAVDVRRDFDFLSAEYADLHGRSAATAFQHPVWLEALYRRLAPRFAAEPLVVTVSEDGRLLLVLPMLRRRRGGLRMIEFADLGVTDYAAPVCTPATYERLCTDPAVARRIRAVLRPYDVLRVPKQRSDSLDLSRLLGKAAALPMSGQAHAVGLDTSPERWRETQLDPSYRRELDKKRRKLERKGDLRLERLSDGAEIAAAFAATRDFRRERLAERNESDILSDPAAMAFYVDVATEGAKAGLTRLYRLTLDGRTIATVFGLSADNRFMVVATAFDTSFKRLTLGGLMLDMVVADCIGSGDEVFDLTIGDESYKTSFGTSPTPLSTVIGSGSMIGALARQLMSRPGSLAIVKGLSHSRPRGAAGLLGLLRGFGGVAAGPSQAPTSGEPVTRPS